MAVDVGDTPLWAWIVATVLALLGAGGGIAALKGMFRREVKIKTTLGFESSDYYHVTHGKQALRIAVDTSTWPEPADLQGAEPLRARLLLEVRNQRESPVTVDAVELLFTSIEPLTSPPPPAIIVMFVRGAGPDAIADVADRLGVALDSTGAAGARYVARQTGVSPEDVAAELTRDPSVRDAFPDATGQADTPFVSTEPVAVNLTPGRREYSMRIAETLAGHDALTVNLDLGASEPLRGTGRVMLRYQGDRRTPVGDIVVELRFPAFVRTVEGAGTR